MQESFLTASKDLQSISQRRTKPVAVAMKQTTQRAVNRQWHSRIFIQPTSATSKLGGEESQAFCVISEEGELFHEATQRSKESLLICSIACAT